ncbi:CHAD domain-containing protein, partial [Deinococcus pimensis]|uniref:CHAD domain-containing protein n=1 Tax=Deinococcus pimensis TaxID=309888 RepID=UPI0012F78188
EAREVFASTDEDTWHEWRKNLKRWRYTLELAGEAPRELLDVLQELGRAQDATVIRAALADEALLPAHRDALLRREEIAEAGSRERARAAWEALERRMEQEEVK